MTVDDARGRTWRISRRMTFVPWKPRRRRIDPTDGIDLGLDSAGDPTGFILSVALIAVVVLLVAVLAPFLILVLEVALVFALLVPLLFACAVVGLRRHSVIAVREQSDETLVRENVRFLWRSRSIMREWAAGLASVARITDPLAVRR